MAYTIRVLQRVQIQGLGFNEGLKGFINVLQGVPQRIPEGLSKSFFTGSRRKRRNQAKRQT